MNPLCVTATNYRTFERLDVDLPEGVVAIVGPNGAGKSSVLNAIDVALFAGRGELPPLLTVGADDLEIELTFEHAGELYRVRRQLRRGKSPTCDLERRVASDSVYVDIASMAALADSGWEPLTLANVDATNERIEEILGLSRTTFRASSFLRQGDGAAFTEATPAARKGVLAEILDLAVWDRLLDLARGELRTVETDLAKIAHAIGEREQTAALRPHVEETLREVREIENRAAGALAVGDRDLERAQQRVAENAAAVERVRTWQAELTAANAELARARAAVAEAETAVRLRAEKQAELATVATVADQVEACEVRVQELRDLAARATAALRERAAAEQAAATAQAELARMERDTETRRKHALELDAKAAHLRSSGDGDETCDRCGQHLGAEARARAIDSFMGEASTIMLALEREIPTLLDLRDAAAQAAQRVGEVSVPELVDPAPAERELAAARAAAERRAALAVEARTYAERAATLAQHQESLRVAIDAAAVATAALARATEACADPAVLAAAVDAARETVTAARATLDDARNTLARHQAHLDRIQEAERDLGELRTEQHGLQQRLDVLHLAVRAFGRDGIPALIVENAAIPQIEVEANRILNELGTPYRVELRTQRELKTGDQLRETLDIVIVAPGGDRPYETFSGGERTRLNLALRIGLARLLAHRRGAESRLLAIDEPEFLDEAGVERLADVLRGLSGDFDRILLVSHHPTLAGSMDRTLTVMKDGDRSRIDTGAREAVTA